MVDRPFVFECPRTRQSVQTLVDEDLLDSKAELVPMDCALCGRPHLINPKTRKGAWPSK